MPGLQDPRFYRALIYVCSHDHQGTMGLVVNKHLPSVRLGTLLSQMDIPHEDPSFNPPVHFGGPVEIARGFVLHSPDYLHSSSVKISADIALTANVDILAVMGSHHRPKHCLLALGYSGWGVGQLDAEIQKNSWLQGNGDSDILFDSNIQNNWQKALRGLGVVPERLYETPGHA